MNGSRIGPSLGSVAPGRAGARRSWPGVLPRLVASAAVAAVLAALGTAPNVRAQDEPVPVAPPGCDPVSDRTVTPSETFAGGAVDVALTFDPACRPFEEIGVDVMFVVDRSITMGADDYFAATRRALGDFVLAMNMETSSAGLVTFASTDSISRNLSKDRDDLVRAINAIRLTEENDTRGLLGALRTATEKLTSGSPDNEKVVMIVVAGAESSQPLVTMPTVTQAARNAGVRFVFLMFPDARFTHFVQSASLCHAGCPSWRGPRAGDPVMMRWAWGVERDGPSGIEAIIDVMIDKLLREVSVTEIEFWESFEDDVEFDESSAAPPPSRVEFGADAFWTYSSVPPGGRNITYKARMLRPGATYPVTVRTEVTVGYSDGFRTTYTLPNPDVTVREGAPPSPTATATEIPPSPTPTSDLPSETPEPATPTATTPPTAPPTDEPGGTAEIYLPLVYREGG